MLAVVNQPRTRNTEKASFRIEGDIPKFVMVFLESAFQNSIKIDDDDETVRWDDTDISKEIRKRTSPAEAVFLNRDMRGWTQADLAKKLSVAVTVVSDIENGRRSVSRSMAVKLGEAFGSDPAAFFDFSRKDSKSSV